MENEKQLTEIESIEVIQKMINTVKNDLEDSSFYFLLWGWFVFVASTGHYLLWQMDYSNPEMVWLLMPVGAVITFFYGRKQGKKQKVKSYTEDIMKYVLIAFLISLATVLFMQGKLQLNTYPMVMMIYAVWLFISGGAIKFKPLIFGGIVNWILGIISFFVTFKIQLLLLALAVLLGYIIPGHMLKSRYQKLKAA
jgi:hypothetical protein